MTTETPIELLPCPFCGSSCELVSPKRHEAQYWYVGCSNGKCPMDLGCSFDSAQTAISGWNTRTHYTTDEGAIIAALEAEMLPVGDLNGHYGWNFALTHAIDIVRQHDLPAKPGTVTTGNLKASSGPKDIPLYPGVSIALKISRILVAEPPHRQLDALMDAFAPYIRTTEPVSIELLTWIRDTLDSYCPHVWDECYEAQDFKKAIDAAGIAEEKPCWLTPCYVCGKTHMSTDKCPKKTDQPDEYPECSGDPSSCPENEGYGCCKPVYKGRNYNLHLTQKAVDHLEHNSMCEVAQHDECDECDGQGWAVGTHDGITPEQMQCEICYGTGKTHQSPDCRSAFEDWLPTQGYLLGRKEDGRYDSSHTQIMWVAWQEAWRECSKKREISNPLPDMGMKMADVRVGMKMKCLYGGSEITVTELTDNGFKYSHPPYHLGARIGQTTGGEHYGYNGYSHYTQIEGELA